MAEDRTYTDDVDGDVSPQVSGFVNVSSLERWSSVPVKSSSSGGSGGDQGHDENDDVGDAGGESKEASRFPFDANINSKIVLWSGQLCDLDADAIVNTTNERLNERSGLSGHIFQRAGSDLVDECLRLDGCHTGEAVITKGYELPAHSIIHTVGPRFSVKYQTAAENALHGCYRRCLEVLKENSLKSIAFPVVNTARKGYPKEAAAHVAFRTVRRFLEHWPNDIDTVVFCTDTDEDKQVYERVLPIYFPRNAEEERRVLSLIPAEVGNEWGERVIADRQIRISAMPGMSGDDDFSDASDRGAGFTSPQDDVEDRRDDFSNMQANPDESRTTKSKQDSEEAKRIYESYLARARDEDLSDIAQHNFIYESGTDLMGRPVVVLVASRLPADTVDHERILLYLIQFLDPIVEHNYTFVYFHTNIASENKPPFKFLKNVYSIFNRKYKKNLKRLYIVHPTFWVRLLLMFATPFISNKFWRKLTKVDRLMDLYEDFEPHSLNIPEEITRYDQEKNGADYASQYQNGGGRAGNAEDVEDL